MMRTNSLTLRLRGLLFLFVLALCAASFYFEYVLELKPCSLCIMQRVAFLLLLLVLFVYLFARSKFTHRCCFFATFGVSFLGALFSLRQLYLQSLPPGKIPACGPGLNVLIKYFPLKDIMRALFYGSGDCAVVDWTFLGFSMSFYALLSFILVMGSLLYTRDA